MKRLILLPILALLLFGQVGPVTPAPITGDSATHQFATVQTGARTVLIICPSTNAAAVYIGDSSTSATQGWPCAPGGSFSLAPLTANQGGSQGQTTYDLSKWYYYATSGDKLYWGYTR